MRAETRPHPTHLWTDRRINQLPLSQKRMLDYAWTGPDMNGIGVTTVEVLVFQARVGELADSVENCLRFLSGFVMYDEGTQEIFVLDWFRFHKFSSPAGKAAALKGLGECRSDKIKEEVKRRAELAGWDVFKPKTPVPDDEKQGSNENQQLSPPTATSTAADSTTALVALAAFNKKLDCLLRESEKTWGWKGDEARDRQAIAQLRDWAELLGGALVLNVIAGAQFPSQALRAGEKAGLLEGYSAAARAVLASKEQIDKAERLAKSERSAAIDEQAAVVGAAKYRIRRGKYAQPQV